ncbi:alpha-1,2-fucosyltransferase [Vibrio mimicus]
MIIVKIIGGLGNQMFQYALARSIELQTNTEVKLDLQGFDTYQLHNGYRLNCFNIAEKIATKSEVEKYIGSNNYFYRAIRRFCPSLLKMFQTEKNHTKYDGSLFELKRAYLDGYWHNGKYFEPVREQLLKEFTIKGELSKGVRELRTRIVSSQSVSIHVRRGDFLKHPDVGVLDIDYYKRAVECILSNVESPEFYMFSDDIEWCIEHLNFIENCHFVDSTIDELDDLMLMSSCKHNIIANSTFSWWGAWLNSNHNKIVVCPKVWMKINPQNFRWALDEWTEL